MFDWERMGSLHVSQYLVSVGVRVRVGVKGQGEGLFMHRPTLCSRASSFSCTGTCLAYVLLFHPYPPKGDGN